MKKRPSNSVADFHRRFGKVVSFMEAKYEEKGYDKTFVLTVLVVLYGRWVLVYTKWLDKQNRTPIITAEKNALLKEARKAHSAAVRMLKGNILTTDAELIALEIAPNARTHHDKTPVTVTLPEVTTDTSVPKGIFFTVKEEGVESKGKPAGGQLIGFRSKIVTVYPNDVDELNPMVIYSTTTFRVDFPQEAQGGMLAYACCWISPTGEIGEWSRIAIVFIP